MSNKCGGGNLDSESSEIKRCIRALKEVDLELAYLALLSCEGLKPLSRWEKPLGDNGLGLLRQTGLLAKQIRRTVKTGRDVVETVFSRSPAYIQLYEQRFGNKPIDKSVQTQRFEGFLFGYPPCCVNQYTRRPYAPNKLTGPEQKILFHWACRDCKITPVLSRAYKSVYDLLNCC
ncbi:MAG: hypothetical protein ACYSYV_10710 [Planctomycetota bacterium]|jgi:hypothetical protein